MDATSTIGGFQALGSYGIAGAIAAGLLTLFVLIFRKLIENVLDQNKSLQESQTQIVHALNDMRESIRELTREQVVMFNQMVSEPRPRPVPTESTRRLTLDPNPRRPPTR